jgi:hypothetical protein
MRAMLSSLVGKWSLGPLAGGHVGASCEPRSVALCHLSEASRLRCLQRFILRFLIRVRLHLSPTSYSTGPSTMLPDP